MRKNRATHQPQQASFIVPRNQHNVSKTDISVNALKVLNRLNSAGFEAYLVGGGVRDLLLGTNPKDFDVATNATPSQVKNLFRNSRIIGRRFKLVHILFHREVIEVATFRKGHEESETHVNEKGMIVRDNVFGSLNEDAWRRDFTINSLYYSADNASIIDHTGGVEDIHGKLIRMIGDPRQRYQEDPVRMLRAIRFSAKLHFSIEEHTAKAITEFNHLLADVSSSRLFDEITKLYQCGASLSAHELLIQYRFFEQLFEQTHESLQDNDQASALINTALESTDARIKAGKPVTPAFLFAVFLWYPLQKRQQYLQTQHEMAPLAALEKAMNDVLHQQSQRISIPKRHTQVVREIWLLQFRFNRRHGNKPHLLLEHPRFRAAYDFMVMRALAGDEHMDLAQWWTSFQDVTDEEKEAMIAELPKRKPRKRTRKKTTASNTQS